VPTEKARELVHRGVRRVFCLLVTQQRVVEWSREIDGWRTMHEKETIEDRCLVRPIEVAALLDVTAAEEAVAEGLVARGAPAIERVRAQGEASGRADALLALLAARGIAIDEARRGVVLACTELATLDRWIVRAAVATSAAEVFGER
jgi:hypothetical protein